MAFSLTGPVFEEHPHLKGKHKDYVKCWATQGLNGCGRRSNQSMHKGNRIQEIPTHIYNPTLSHIYSNNQHRELTALLTLREEQVHAQHDYQQLPKCVSSMVHLVGSPVPPGTSSDVLEGTELTKRKFPTEHHYSTSWDLILSTDHIAGREFEQQIELGLQNFIPPEGK